MNALFIIHFKKIYIYIVVNYILIDKHLGVWC